MRFPFPRFPADFELPDEWWSEAGMSGFTRQGVAYRSTAELFWLDEIEPPFRLLSAALDWRGFSRERMVSILRGFVASDEIAPIDLLALPPLADISRAPFTYRVLGGMHRFYASIAAGFECVPATTRGMCM